MASSLSSPDFPQFPWVLAKPAQIRIAAVSGHDMRLAVLRLKSRFVFSIRIMNERFPFAFIPSKEVFR